MNSSKDGPLSIYSQYPKLVDPIRRFLAFAKEEGWPNVASLSTYPSAPVLKMFAERARKGLLGPVE